MLTMIDIYFLGAFGLKVSFSGLLQKEKAGHTWRKPRRKSRQVGSKEAAEVSDVGVSCGV